MSTAIPLLLIAVASAAGPHWYLSCGKNGVSTSSRDARLASSSAISGGIEAQPESKTKRAGKTQPFGSNCLFRAFLAR